MNVSDPITDTSAPHNEGSCRVTTFVVPAMHCAGCIRTLESGLMEMAQVERARANLSARQVEIVWHGADDVLDQIGDRISRLGFEHHVLDAGGNDEADANRRSRHLLLCLAVAGFAAANIMLLSVSVWSGAEAETERFFGLLSGLIAVPTVFYAGTPFFVPALNALSAGRLNMDVPISLAVLLSLFMSVYEALIGGGETFFDAGVMLLFFLLIGRTLDQLMREKAAGGVKSLAKLLPRMVTRLRVDGTSEHVDIAAIEPGDRLSLLPADRFPVDARVMRGASTADRSVVTGEAGEVPLRAGDTVEAGTLNLSAAIEVEAVSTARTSFLADVMTMMKAAETSKGRYRRIADRMATIYAPVVHLLALVAFIGWVVVTGDIKASLVAAIAVLIITCPCALGLAVPVTHVVAANRLFREGILMRDGSALERLAETDTVFFDKTGTLTSETLRLTAKPQLDEQETSAILAVARQSRHPTARAIAAAYDDGRADDPPSVTEVAGLGVETVRNGKRVRLGRPDWVSEVSNGPAIAPGETVAFAIEGTARHGFSLSSALKTGAAEAVSQIRSQHYRTAILSGDSESNVGDVAARTGIETWRAHLKPAQKVAEIRERSGRALMVGDGLNDAPSLAAAHVSMAPASATDVSRASADFVFTRPSLLAVPFALRLSKAASRIVRQNFAIAIIYNCIAVPLAVLGHVTPLVAAIAMSLSSIVVVANSMRLSLFDRMSGSHENKTHVAHIAPSLEAKGTA